MAKKKKVAALSKCTSPDDAKAFLLDKGLTGHYFVLSNFSIYTKEMDAIKVSKNYNLEYFETWV